LDNNKKKKIIKDYRYWICVILHSSIFKLL